MLLILYLYLCTAQQKIREVGQPKVWQEPKLINTSSFDTMETQGLSH